MEWKTKRYYKEQNEALKLEILNLDKKNVELKDLNCKANETIEELKTTLKSAIKGQNKANKTINEYIQQIEGFKKLIELLDSKLQNTEALRRKAAGKLGGYVKEKNKLLTKITELNDKINALEEEKAKCWIKKTIPSGKTPKGQTIGVKNSSVTSNIIRNIKKEVENDK
jgi:chromosome segregation ATPase